MPVERSEIEIRLKDDLDALRAELADKSIEEIEIFKLGLKTKVEELKAMLRAAEDIRSRKIVRDGLAAKLGVPVDHLSDADAERFLEIARTPKVGDVIVVPGTAALTAKGHGGDA